MFVFVKRVKHRKEVGMSTERIYRKDVYCISNEAVVTEVIQKNGSDIFTCDASCFYPEGGGQPSDAGTAATEKGVFDIVRAYDEDLAGDVWHVTDAPAGTFSAGDRVVLSIDRDRRFRNMQRHLGEHMLSGTMDSLFGGVNRGFHMGDEYITIDIDLDGRMLTEEELDLAERTVNDAIWADLPVTVTRFPDYESSLSLPVRKKVPHEGEVSVVTVGDPEDPYDCIACCGTHPARSSEVGLLSIYKCDPNKGMNRIFFDCGIAAWEKLSADSRMLSDIAKKYSCSPADLASRLDLEAENISSLKARLAALSAYAKENEKERILSGISAPGRKTRAACYTTELLSVDDLLKLGFSVISETEDLLLLMMHPESFTCLLFSSGDAKCGALVKERAPEFGGRGGGRDDNARAVFTSLKDMKAFADALRALR